MVKAVCSPYTLEFRETAITSRSAMTTKRTWLLRLISPELPSGEAVGEVAMFEGLSAEDTPAFEPTLRQWCSEVSRCSSLAEAASLLPKISSIRFGFESALLRATTAAPGSPEQRWLDGERGIRINGLVWMGDKATMRRRIREKLKAGFRCVKLKIGGIDFEDELELLREIRREFTPTDIELRLDANGGFTPDNALQRLDRLSALHIHSLEQPIRQAQWEEMARICRNSPIDIALDEELIGFTDHSTKRRMLETIKPRYIILKPSLCGGFNEADRWIRQAGELGIGWWITSALESNIGLEALGRWTAAHSPVMPQGLGTGNLYTNNFPSPLSLEGERLFYRKRQ